MKKFVFLTLLLCFILQSTSQIYAQTDTLSARRWLSEAISLNTAQKYAAAAEQANKACEVFQAKGDSLAFGWAESTHERGVALFSLSQYQEAIVAFNTTIALWKKRYPRGSVSESLDLFYLALSYGEIGKVSASLEAHQQCYQMRVKVLPPNDPELAISLRYIGQQLHRLNQYAKAIENYEQALMICRKNGEGESVQVAKILGNMGQSYLFQSQYEKAISVQEQSLALRQKLLAPDDPEISSSLYNLGLCYKSLRKYDLALSYYEQSIALLIQKYGPNSEELPALYSEIGQLYMLTKNFEKSREIFQLENEIMIQNNMTQSADYAYTCIDLGRWSYEVKKYKEAVVWYEKAVDLMYKTSEKANSDLASTLCYLGFARGYALQFDAAVAALKEAEGIYLGLFGPEASILHRSYSGLGLVYQNWYKYRPNQALLEQSRYYFGLCYTILSRDVTSDISANGRKKALNDFKPILGKAIETEFLLSQSSQKLQASERAWDLSESLHGFLLYAGTQESNARHFSGIPDSLLNVEAGLRAEITALNKAGQKLLYNKGLLRTDPQVLENNERIFAKQTAHNALKAYFESTYPDYYRLKYNLKNVGVKQVQSMLTADQCLLEYYITDSVVFVLVVQQQAFQLIALPKDFPLNDWCTQMRQGLYDYHTSTQKTPALYETTVKDYAMAAQGLYQKLLAPIAGWLKPELILVLDAELNYIPFESLLSGPPKDLSNFKTFPFLVLDRQVSYAASATMLFEMFQKKNNHEANAAFLAFAPFYFSEAGSAGDLVDRKSFKPLPYSGEEVARVRQRIGGQGMVLTGARATLDTFLQVAGQYKIIHLGTHGKANEVSSDFSYIAFAVPEDTMKNNLLYVGDLYNIELNAALVVLSACETGIGAMQRGEGVISLSRGFAYAGAKSIITSLWSVNDQSTMQLMDVFYGQVKLGKNLNFSLSEAKRQYIANQRGLALHPFYWSGFVLHGGMGPLK